MIKSINILNIYIFCLITQGTKSGSDLVYKIIRSSSAQLDEYTDERQDFVCLNQI